MHRTLTNECYTIGNLNQFDVPKDEKPNLRKKLLDEGLIKCNFDYTNNRDTLTINTSTPYKLTDIGKKKDDYTFIYFFYLFSVILLIIVVALYFTGSNDSTMRIVLYIAIGVFVLCNIISAIIHYRNPLRHFKSDGVLHIKNRPRKDDPNIDFSRRDD